MTFIFQYPYQAMLEQNLNSNSNPNAEKLIYKVFDHSNLCKKGDEFCILWYTIRKYV